ncbi:DUF2946 family protein [Oryzibacter oryziterrae]|uniref:DUF2946 family protein n=1 Tax=Oryzibacter oryziterrae TaxID=2766474 RepID=UPI001F23906D|nr:DUF2946 family protein [Oryzibacter oryziterrae]
MSVLTVYALVLQILLPLSAATASAAESGNGVPVYCKLMLDAPQSSGATLPMDASHDCQICCLQSGAVADLPKASVAATPVVRGEAVAFSQARLDLPLLTRGAPPSLRGPPSL